MRESALGLEFVDLDDESARDASGCGCRSAGLALRRRLRDSAPRGAYGTTNIVPTSADGIHGGYCDRYYIHIFVERVVAARCSAYGLSNKRASGSQRPRFRLYVGSSEAILPLLSAYEAKRPAPLRWLESRKRGQERSF